ncbi:methyl-accepting chemotaxis protein [Geomonas sp. Red69]|uniref:Methyl-accepting chemotaxis protein n=1 Tax=Geomonas diazotrophica TaxID=2843197 RepID=A0ABX8JI65_9BACT|nr:MULTISPECIES: methyl-accepting chemotaxis protein [Geomonas]MBU5635682.1 methyl-accepting chemotaxis protein [Geomonas diazotrophica]QWV98078.1 methyl-accepting chemotaxis protein [Geomonas nitrogeniifigens]QXE87210.1 methyl-accepting chemotaxis protein [Geomonas nitrogeniifigens]
MYIQIGYKFILGFLAVVAAVVFVPSAVQLLQYSPELTSVISYVVALTVGLILGSFFSKSFTKNISLLTGATESISQGDLSRDLNFPATRFPDETHSMALSINTMQENLRALVRQIRETSERVSESSRTLSSSALEINASTEEVAQAIESISGGAENQAEMLAKSAKVIHEMAISVDLVARRAKETAKAARETSLTAQKGGELANDSVERLKSFFDSVELISMQFMDLNGKLQQVGKIADFIVEMSRQTNLLALNASIEAARAGEYGKGFGVVAEEVRKLADGSAKSATDIVELIDLVKVESRRLQETITDSSRGIIVGKKNLDVTADAFREILATVVETERKANSIADLSQMQTTGAAKMVSMVDEIAKVAEDNAASTEEVSAATEEQHAAMQEMVFQTQELAQLAGELLRSVERFQVEPETVPEPEA